MEVPDDYPGDARPLHEPVVNLQAVGPFGTAHDDQLLGRAAPGRGCRRLQRLPSARCRKDARWRWGSERGAAVTAAGAACPAPGLPPVSGALAWSLPRDAGPEPYLPADPGGVQDGGQDSGDRAGGSHCCGAAARAPWAPARDSGLDSDGGYSSQDSCSSESCSANPSE